MGEGAGKEVPSEGGRGHMQVKNRVRGAMNPASRGLGRARLELLRPGETPGQARHILGVDGDVGVAHIAECRIVEERGEGLALEQHEAIDGGPVRQAEEVRKGALPQEPGGEAAAAVRRPVAPPGGMPCIDTERIKSRRLAMRPQEGLDAAHGRGQGNGRPCGISRQAAK